MSARRTRAATRAAVTGLVPLAVAAHAPSAVAGAADLAGAAGSGATPVIAAVGAATLAVGAAVLFGMARHRTPDDRDHRDGRDGRDGR